jgi:membrane associated rhomboid family serine protease
MWLHAGILHFLVNMLALLRLVSTAAPAPPPAGPA